MQLTASNRAALIRLASSLPVGSPERRTIIAGLRDGSNLTDEALRGIHDIFSDVIRDEQVAIKALKGRDGGLRPSKPKDPLYAYIWRMARFHSGDDPRMPVTADFDLAEGVTQRLRARGIEKFHNAEWEAKQKSYGFSRFRDDKPDSVGSLDIPSKETKRLDPFIDQLVVKLGSDPMGAARRWKGLLY
jgi:hypothetical protein